MSDELDGYPIDAPDVCTLPTAELPLRQAEFDDVLATAIEAHRATDRHLRLVLAGPPDLIGRVRDLAARETACCSFFTFTVTPDAASHVVLDIEVTARHVAVLDSMALRAARAAAR